MQSNWLLLTHEDASGTLVYGASDDLLEFEGEFRGESGAGGDESVLGLLSDGTLFTVRYTEHGVWKIEVVNRGPLFGRLEPVALDETLDPYSDVLVMKRGVRWAYVCRQFERVT